MATAAEVLAGAAATPSSPFAGTVTGVASRVDRVHVDGMVLLKIIKHAHGMLPQYAAGSLLGLDEKNTLDVTNTFPFPQGKSTEATYQTDMLEVMRRVNVDANIVGWYQSTFLGSYCTKDLLLTQFDFQLHLGSGAVVLIYDPAASMSGTLSLKALRLTRAFMTAFKNKAITIESLATSTVSMNSVFEELPVRIRNPHLVNALLLDLQAATTPISRLPKAGTGAES
ncbi:eif3H, partial [Symbiodinium sp. KB8]